MVNHTDGFLSQPRIPEVRPTRSRGIILLVSRFGLAKRYRRYSFSMSLKDTGLHFIFLQYRRVVLVPGEADRTEKLRLPGHVAYAARCGRVPREAGGCSRDHHPSHPSRLSSPLPHRCGKWALSGQCWTSDPRGHSWPHRTDSTHKATVDTHGSDVA